MSIEELEKRVLQLETRNRALMDRQEIHEIVMRYCRAVDRLDRELLLSCYHPDAINDHGIFLGSPEALADWVFPWSRDSQIATQHCITNHFCDVEGDVAHAESYYHCADMNRQGPPLLLCGGRYIDRFERRKGKWGIVARVHRMEWWGTPGEMKAPEKVDSSPQHDVARDRSDPSYERPLSITQKAAGWRVVW